MHIIAESVFKVYVQNSEYSKVYQKMEMKEYNRCTYNIQLVNVWRIIKQLPQ